MSTSSSGYRPRLAIEITQEQQQALQRLFPYGTQRAFFAKLIEEVIEVAEIGGTRAIAAILSEALSPRDILPTLDRLKKEFCNGDPGDSSTT